MSSAAATTTIIHEKDDGVDGDNDDYIVTISQNYVSRRAQLEGSHQVEIKGKTVVMDGVRIAGDVAPVRLGRYCFVHSNTAVIPPTMPFGRTKTNTKTTNNDTANATPAAGGNGIPVTIGSHSTIGRECRIHAAAIGSFCWIGDNVTIGERCIVKDCCVIANGTIVPADTVLPPFTRASMTAPPPEDEEKEEDYKEGSLSTTTSRQQQHERRRLVTHPLPPAAAVELQERAVELFQTFVAARQFRN